MEFASYQLKDVAYQWYEEWERTRGGVDESSLWEDFTNAFLDHLFPLELREEKAEKFVNLKQGSMLVKDYAMKFHQLSRYVQRWY